MKRYNPKDIEPKWQKTWEEQGIYRASEDPAKPKRYVLEFFPYLSGAAMHVGHVRNYAIGDAIARFARMQGQNVLHPMGWDAFGLPAENYAIKTGNSPESMIGEASAKFKEQLIKMGFSYDWSREINSSSPEYYKWTQWMFLLLHKRGLAYQQEGLQWWCPVDKTVLANEQVEAGKCWRCGSEVEKKALKQWFFKITDYADRLLEDLDDLNWSDAIKTMQRNWIGKSKGAEIDFAVAKSGARSKEQGAGEEKIRVFTTRPDTLFGATFMVLAPEHPLVNQITVAEQEAAVEDYVKAAHAKSDVERQETDREKTGVFTGAYAVNPVNDEKIPVWVADYVLGGYGTGAIMAVPAHDERDYEFAVKYDLDIRQVIAPTVVDSNNPPRDGKENTDRTVVMALVKHPSDNKYLTLKWKQHPWHNFVTGGVEDNEELIEAGKREITEETGYESVEYVRSMPMVINSQFYAAHKDVNRNVMMHVIEYRLVDEKQVDTKRDIHEDFEPVWADVKDLPNLKPVVELPYILRWLTGDNLAIGEEGVVINSGKYDGLRSAEAREKIVADLSESSFGEERVNYKIRDWLISRQRYWGAPIPIIHCPKDGAVAVPDDQLPVELPEIKSYEPSGDGHSPLARVDEFVNTTCPKCGGPAKRETDTMDGFACSSWYFLRFADPHNDKEPFSKEKAQLWLPVDDYIGGADHAVMHLLYARFWTKVMYDDGLINFKEPFTTLRNQGNILAPDGQKMSKSKGNVIAPDDLINQGYGADSIRLMELFIGPWNQSVAWSVEGMGGTFRFLQRIWTITQEFLAMETGNSKQETGAAEERLKRTMHATTKKVSEDMHDLGFNTAIAALMECVNELYKIKASHELCRSEPWHEALVTLVQLLAPFAPHIAEELWQQLGQEGSVHTSEWPGWDEKLLVSDTMTIVVQVNGKVRANIEVAPESTEQQVTEAAQSHEKVASYLKNPPKKTIYVPNKLINFVV